MKNIIFLLCFLFASSPAFAQGHRIYVDYSAFGAANGQSWANAYTLGECIHQHTFSNTDFELNLASWPKGLYRVSFLTEHKQIFNATFAVHN